MCLKIRTPKNLFATLDKETKLLVFAKQFNLQDGELLPLARKYKYSYTYQKNKHWLYVRPDIKTQPVDVVFWAKTDQEVDMRYSVTRKMQLGYHAEFFQTSEITPPICGSYTYFPILTTDSEIMMTGSGSVVVRAFRIPDPHYYHQLYKNFLRDLGMSEEAVERLIPTYQDAFKAITKSNKEVNHD
jgi:hypothetical protein